MKNKEIITALGLAVSLSVSACGTEASQPEPVEEVVENTTSEQSTEEAEPVVEEQVEEEKEETASVTSENSIEEKKSEQVEVDTETEEDTGFDIEPMDETKMYAAQNCNIRSGPSTEYDIVGHLTTNQEVTVIGKVNADNGKAWCVIQTDDGSIQMVSGSLLSTEKVSTSKPKPSGGSGSGSSGSGTTKWW